MELFSLQLRLLPGHFGVSSTLPIDLSLASYSPCFPNPCDVRGEYSEAECKDETGSYVVVSLDWEVVVIAIEESACDVTDIVLRQVNVHQQNHYRSVEELSAKYFIGGTDELSWVVMVPFELG